MRLGYSGGSGGRMGGWGSSPRRGESLGVCGCTVGLAFAELLVPMKEAMAVIDPC